jgi:uncharacterized protein YndB with AHSA1/START domain
MGSWRNRQSLERQVSAEAFHKRTHLLMMTEFKSVGGETMRLRQVSNAFRSGGLYAALAFVCAASCPAGAAVVDLAANGFTVQVAAHISATPDRVYAALITPARWWSPDHTFSGSSANLSVEAKAGGCWCEKLPNGGSVAHLTVVYTDPGKLFRLRGALGPFQSHAVDGAMTWSLKAGGGGTELSLEYTLGGYIKGGFEPWSKAVDGMLSEQFARLKRFIETGSPDGH